jgi:hypothetical protein
MLLLAGTADAAPLSPVPTLPQNVESPLPFPFIAECITTAIAGAGGVAASAAAHGIVTSAVDVVIGLKRKSQQGEFERRPYAGRTALVADHS